MNQKDKHAYAAKGSYTLRPYKKTALHVRVPLQQLSFVNVRQEFLLTKVRLGDSTSKLNMFLDLLRCQHNQCCERHPMHNETHWPAAQFMVS